MYMNVFFISVIFLGIFAIVVLLYVERKDKKELYLLNKRKKVIEYYLQKISDIENMKDNNYKKIEKIKFLSKKLFNEYYETDINMSYPQLKNFFEDKSNDSLVEFSKIMIDLYYSPKSINNKTIEKLILILRKEIIHSQTHDSFIKIISNKTREEKNLKIKFLLKKAKKNIEKKDYYSAEKVHNELVETNINPKFHNKINKIHDKIIKLYNRQKNKNIQK